MTAEYRNVILQGDVLDRLRELPNESVHCCVTSPPYWGLRDYGVAGAIGLEATPEAYVTRMVEVFREVRRVLRSDGTLWLNLGDSYAADGHGTGASRTATSPKQVTNGGSYFKDAVRPLHGVKPKDLIGMPWRVAFALQADGWYLRSEITWCKAAPMPELGDREDIPAVEVGAVLLRPRVGASAIDSRWTCRQGIGCA